MAQLTITVPDAAVVRIRAAFGTGGNPATVAQVQDAVKALILQQVIAFESSAQVASVVQTAQQEVWP